MSFARAVSKTRTSGLVASATGLASLTLLPVVQFVVEALGGLGEALMVALLPLVVLALVVLALVEALAEALLALVGALLEALPETLLLLAEALLAWARTEALTEALMEALLLLVEALAQVRSLQTLLPQKLQTLLPQKLLKSEAAHRGCSSSKAAATAHRLPAFVRQPFPRATAATACRSLAFVGQPSPDKKDMVLASSAGRSCRNLRAPGKGGWWTCCETLLSVLFFCWHLQVPFALQGVSPHNSCRKELVGAAVLNPPYRLHCGACRAGLKAGTQGLPWGPWAW